MKLASASASASASAFCMALLAGCAGTQAPGPAPVVRTRAPINYEKSIASFFDLTIKGPQKNRELSIGKPQPGGCPVGGHITSERGWVVPVVYVTRTGAPTGKEAMTITAKEHYFWFRQDTIYGVTPRAELCP